MSYCASCGAAMPAEGVFCGNCGHRVGSPIPAVAAVPVPPAVVPPVAPSPVAPTVAVPSTVALGPTPTPPPPPPSRRNPMLAVVAVLAVAAIGAGIIIFATHGDKKSSAPSGTGDMGTSTSVLGSSTTAAASTVASTTMPVDPLVQLQQLAASDRATADTLVGHFVVQLSAKKVGLTVNGLTYGPAEILAEHQKLRSGYGAILVDASQFKFTSGGKSMDGWYLTIVPTTFASKVAADKWCTDHGLAAADCFSRVFMSPK